MSGAHEFVSSETGALQSSKIMEDTSQLTSIIPVSNNNICKVNSTTLQDGIEVTHWFARFEKPVKFPVHDDNGRVCFSFTSQLEGSALCVLDQGGDAYRLEENTACIHYGPGRLGNYQQHGIARNLTITVDRELLSGWPWNTDSALNRILESGGYLQGYRGGELLATAQLLSRELPLDGEIVRHPLWLHGQALALVGLMLEAGEPTNGGRRRPNEAKSLHAARDRLLADLSCAPNLVELVKETGLSVSTLTRGFRKLFGNSPYGLFQQERMRVARLRLLAGDVSVTSVAIDLGYTNVGHFSTAFRKEFGVLPSEIGRIGAARYD